MLRTRARFSLDPQSSLAIALNISSTTSESTRHGDGHGPYPVLARLFDISDDLSKVAPRSNRAAAAGFVSYRFDPPENSERGVQRKPEMAEAIGLAATPHILRRSTSNQDRVESPILPRSNPFAIPAETVEDRLAPVARFLFFFALFTAVGTAILAINGRPEPVKDVAEPATTAAKQSLEPARAGQVLKPQPDVLEAPAAPPTAAGPLGTKAPSTGLRSKQDKQSAIQIPQSAVAPDSSALRTADARGPLVPHVQTSDRRNAASDGALAEPPAMARLSGSILAAPTQQAHHDDNQSSLH